MAFGSKGNSAAGAAHNISNRRRDSPSVSSNPVDCLVVHSLATFDARKRLGDVLFATQPVYCGAGSLLKPLISKAFSSPHETAALTRPQRWWKRSTGDGSPLLLISGFVSRHTLLPRGRGLVSVGTSHAREAWSLTTTSAARTQLKSSITLSFCHSRCSPRSQCIVVCVCVCVTDLSRGVKFSAASPHVFHGDDDPQAPAAYHGLNPPPQKKTKSDDDFRLPVGQCLHARKCSDRTGRGGGREHKANWMRKGHCQAIPEVP